MQEVLAERVTRHVDAPLARHRLADRALEEQAALRYKLAALSQRTPADLDDRPVQLVVLMPGCAGCRLPHALPEQLCGPRFVDVDVDTHDREYPPSAWWNISRQTLR